MKKIVYILFLILSILSCANYKNKTEYLPNNYYSGIFFKVDSEDILNKKARKLCIKGFSKMKKEKYLKAKEYFVKADLLEKDNLIILNSLANVQLYLGYNDSSILIYDKLLNIDSSYLGTYINYSYLLNYMYQFEDARDLTLKALQKETESRIVKSILLYHLAISCEGLNDCFQAITFAMLSKKYLDDKELLEEMDRYIEHLNNDCNEDDEDMILDEYFN